MSRSTLDISRQIRLGSRPPDQRSPVPAGQDRIPYLSGSQARQVFLRFFAERGHTVLPSYPLVPVDDPSLLWINCGMAPLKPFFQGIAKPPNVRLATSQKSIRLIDIENVGLSLRHHTFFEMLGNFSIGDYFKRESIVWAWELVTEHYRLPPELLYVTVHPTDDEARQLWLTEVGFPADRIYDDPGNFWDIGVGPCGPNSEIYIDRGPAFGCGEVGCGPLCECGRYLEFYNLVFTQFNHNEDGSHTPLPRVNIDTGMGLERISAIAQGVASNFETDLLWPLVDGAAQLLGTPYGKEAATDIALRVIADHVRSVVYCIADGPLPANDGRGYIIRRLLRRAARYGLAAGVTEPFLCELAPVAARLMADEYPEVATRVDHLTGVIRQEEERFGAALREGMKIAQELVSEAKDSGRGSISGHDAFMLYDTFGFPLDLTEDLAREHGLELDRQSFEREMSSQRQRARAARSHDAGWESDAAAVSAALAGVQPPEFVGYEQLAAKATVTGIVLARKRVLVLPAAGDNGTPGPHEVEVYVSLDRTPFYAEAGGQVADLGWLVAGGERLPVTDVQRLTDGRIVHRVKGGVASLQEGQIVTAEVDAERREAVARNHTATHLIHRALKEVLGDRVNQAGSLVAPDRLRFDFTHTEALTAEQMAEIERRASEAVLRDLPVTWCEVSMSEAREMGAVALFGEQYGERVRVVSAGEWTRELCGGTHVASTGRIGLVHISGESSIGSGIRRLEAMTGDAAREHLRRESQILDRLATSLRTGREDLLGRYEELQVRLRELERENERLRLKLARAGLEGFLARAGEVAPGAMLVVGQVEASSVDELRSQADLVRDRLGPSGVGVLAAQVGDKAAIVVTVGAELTGRGLRAGDVARAVSAIVGGSGGGRADMAQAGGKDPSQIGPALAAVKDMVAGLLAEGRKG